MWIDTNQCDESFHKIERLEGEWVVLHADPDDEPCDAAEFDVSDLVVSNARPTNHFR